jgi:glycosyltransferase involved in cell wall biosynthesis
MASLLMANSIVRGATDQFFVTLCQSAASYQAGLAAKLARAGLLRRVLRFGPQFQVLEPDADGSLNVVTSSFLYELFNRYLWAGWGLLPRREGSQIPIVATTWLAGRMASACVPRGGIFHGLPALALPSLRVRSGTSKSLLENATLHPRHWQREVLHDCVEFGVSPKKCSAVLPSPLVRRLEQEYELCDAVVVPSTNAARSFEEAGLAHKTVVVEPGVDETFFCPAPNNTPSLAFRACFVGRIEISKGIGYLLQAWRRLALPQAELVLVGPVHPEIKSVLRRYALSNVVLTGALPRQEVIKQYHSASLFIHPSANEGLGLVLLEAMACGIPVVATNRSGANDCVTHGKDGLVVSARHVESLAEAMSWCFRHRYELPAMGAAARQKVEQRFTRAQYEERQLAVYRRLVADGQRAGIPSRSVGG